MIIKSRVNFLEQHIVVAAVLSKNGVLRNNYILPLITPQKNVILDPDRPPKYMVLTTNSNCDTFINPNRTKCPDHEDEYMGAPHKPWALGALPQRGNVAEEGRYAGSPPLPLGAFGRAPRGHGDTCSCGLLPPRPCIIDLRGATSFE